MNTDLRGIYEGPLAKKVVVYTVPIILTGVLQLLFNAADLVVVGWFGGGSSSVGAVGATGSIINLITNLFIGLSIGAGVQVAQGIGARRDADVSRAVHTALPTAVIGGAVMTVIGVFGARHFLAWMQTPSDIIDLSTVYMQIYFAGIISSMVYNFGASILRAAGDTRGPLLYLTVAGVINVVLNIFFVAALKMDVAGVALATAISQTVSAVLVVLALMRRTDACRYVPAETRIYGQVLLEMLRIGVPAGLQGSLFSISNVLIQSSINSFGSVATSGNAAAGNIEGFVYAAVYAYEQTALNFTGQCYGAGRLDRIKRVMFSCLMLSMVTSLVLGVAGYLCGRPLLSIYIPDAPDAIAFGLERMSIVCACYFLDALMDVITGILRGMGSSFAPMLITVMGVCVFRVFWIYTVFQKYHSLRVLYYSYPISWTITFLVQLAVFFILFEKKKRRMELDRMMRQAG